MAYPFGGHPTIGAFLYWIHHEHGFKVRSGTAPDRSGKQHATSRIFKEGAPTVILIGDQDEHLSPSQLWHLERRLGVKTDWFSVDPGA